MLNDVEFRESNELERVDRVKIVACDAKSALPVARNDGWGATFQKIKEI